jgi:AcrR family transcriptional regulator
MEGGGGYSFLVMAAARFRPAGMADSVRRPCGFRPEVVRTYVLVVMAYPAYLRERARELRITKKLSLDEIAERLALPKTTVYYWIKDLPLGRERKWSAGQRKGNRAMQNKWRLLREAAYAQGLAEYDQLIQIATFRDFVVLYIAEGFKRCRNTVSLANSDERVVAMATGWLRLLSRRKLCFSIQYHADQDLAELRSFWGNVVGTPPEMIRLQRKSNSGQLKGRSWRSAHGVLTIATNDTYLRARLQAWIDRIRKDWALDSATPMRGVAQPGSAPALGAGGPRFESGRPDFKRHCTVVQTRLATGRS